MAATHRTPARWWLAAGAAGLLTASLLGPATAYGTQGCPGHRLTVPGAEHQQADPGQRDASAAGFASRGLHWGLNLGEPISTSPAVPDGRATSEDGNPPRSSRSGSSCGKMQRRWRSMTRKSGLSDSSAKTMS